MPKKKSPQQMDIYVVETKNMVSKCEPKCASHTRDLTRRWWGLCAAEEQKKKIKKDWIDYRLGAGMEKVSVCVELNTELLMWFHGNCT